MDLYSATSQPYGTLSNNAIVPMTIDSVRWSCVNEYVYVSLFTSAESRERMRASYATSPYDMAVKIKTQEDEQVYLDAIVYGTRIKYGQNKQLRDRLMSTVGSALVINSGDANEARRLHALYNQLRYDQNNVFYDDRYGEVAIDRVAKVIAGVADKLMVDPNVLNDPFPVMEERYKHAVVKSDYKPIISALDSLDEIVPVVKLKLRKQIYQQELTRFKSHLLDVSLNHLLKTLYPNVSPEDYELAKRQQSTKEHAKIPTYEENLYAMYVNKTLPTEIVDKLEWYPEMPTTNVISTETIQSVEEQSSTHESASRHPLSRLELPPPLTTTEVVLDAEFLPAYASPVKIEGQTYPSVVAFAYSVLFKRLGRPVRVDDYPLDKLVQDYVNERQVVMETVITKNNEIASKHKYVHPGLIALLLTTGNNRLHWGDVSDPVLGGQSNRMGTYLEHLRTQMSPPTDIMTTKPDPVYTDWFASRAADYANTLKMFRKRSVQALETVYGRRANASVSVNATTEFARTIMNESGLSAQDQAVALPMIAADFALLTGDGSRMSWTSNMVRSYDYTPVSHQVGENADKTLSKIYAIVKADLYPNVTRLAFIARILSNQPVPDVKQMSWARLNYWGRMQR